TLVILPADESEPVDTPEAMITSPDMDIVLESGGSDQVVYTATSNIDGATYSLVDYTDYSVASDDSDNNSDDDQPQIPAETVITVPEVQADTQHVYISDAQMSEDGSQVTVTFSYLADNANLSGVGMSVNFDSSVLSVSSVSDVFAGAIASGTQAADSNDTDSDTSTDQTLSFGWASLFSQFPGSTAVDLARVTFDIDDATVGMTGLSLVRTSSQAGYTFDGQSQDLVISANSASDNNAGSDESQAPAESVIIVPEVQANTQHVYVSESTKSEDGTQVTVTYSYLADNANLSGIGMSLNFDSSVLAVSEVSNVFTGAIASGSQSADSSDTDADSTTDQKLSFGWASLFGQFPGSVPVELATVTFDIVDTNADSSGLNVVRTSSAAGYGFDGQSYDVLISADTGSGSDDVSSALSIDSATGAVTLAGEANYQNVSDYNFIVTAANEADSVSKDVDLLVVTESLEGQFSYSGTSVDDFVHVKNPSAGSSFSSGPGNDVMLLDNAFGHSDILLLEDFESGIDSIDASLSIISLGYTSLSSDGAQSAQDGSLRVMRDIDPLSDEILAIVSSFSDSPDSNDFDNAFFSYFDQEVNQFNLVVDLDPSSGITYLDRMAISLDDGVLVDDDDITFNFIS
ncbi:MAG: hypothetical protein P8J42_08170, partial [Pseudomonadales bacterium]|nr:hypothetical protein [Pseudomonadales bacterium]